MRIAVIGSGRLGRALGRWWTGWGHEVWFGSRHPRLVRDDLVAARVAHSAGAPQDVVPIADAVLLAVPFCAMPATVEAIAAYVDRKVVLDATNAFEDLHLTGAREALLHPRGTSGWVAARLPAARVVKAFNTVPAEVLAARAHCPDERVAIPVAADEGAALQVAAELVLDAGFQPALSKPLAVGARFQPGGPLYGRALPGSELERYLPRGGMI
jgi:predicted dinucleotide-binding enzyme